MCSGRSGAWILAALISALAVAASAYGENAEEPADFAPTYYDALGLQNGASAPDIKLAHSKITSAYRLETKLGTDARRQFVAAQQAFQALSDDSSRREALAAVDYFGHVRRLHGDDELRHFTELRPGGAAHLRVIFFLDSGAERRWTVWATATQLDGNAIVAQMGHRDAQAMSGQQAPFMASLKVNRFPCAVIYDPISRAVKVSHRLDGVDSEVQRFLSGESLSPSDKLGRVQELDSESFRVRCGARAGNEAGCAASFVLATTAAQEAKFDELMGTLRTFVATSAMLHNVPEELGVVIACFWLRLGEASEWTPFLQKHGMPLLASVAYTAVLWDPPALAIAPEHMAHGSHIQLQGWFRSVISEGKGARQVDGDIPALPPPRSAGEAPTETTVDRFTRMVKRQLLEVAPGIRTLRAKMSKMDMEEKVMVAGAALCAFLLFLTFCRRCCCCCGRRGGSMSEEAVLASLSTVFEVPLRRQPGEKLGMGINSSANDVFVVTNIVPGQLIERWNSQATVLQRINEGDRIVAAASPGAPQGRARTCKAMSEAMKSGGDLSLFVAPKLRGDAAAEGEGHVASLVLLHGLKLGSVVTLRPPELTWSGVADANGVEVASLGPELEAWNAARRGQGACCMQRLEVGDRIVSVNGSTDVRALLQVSDPLLLVVRLGRLPAERFEAKIERQSQEDRLGLHIRKAPGAQHIEVVECFNEGAIARSNGSGAHRAILPGDRVVEVNGQMEFEAMKRELGKLSLSLRVERWTSEGVGGHGGMPAPTPFSAGPAAAALAPPKVVATAGVSGTAGHGGPAHGTSEGLAPWLFLLALALFVAGVGSGAIPKARPSVYILGARPSQQAYARAGLAAAAVGALLGLRFFAYELAMLRSPAERRMLPQLVVATAASACLGYSALFLSAWAGVAQA